jgi:hypothetical protein
MESVARWLVVSSSERGLAMRRNLVVGTVVGAVAVPPRRLFQWQLVCELGRDDLIVHECPRRPRP